MASPILDNWNVLTDQQQVNSGNRVAVHVGMSCIPFTEMSKADLASAMGNQIPVQAVEDVQIDQGLEWLNPFAFGYSIIVNPIDGTYVGDLRQAAANAMSQLNAAKMVPCTGTLVGPITQYQAASPLTPNITQTVSLAALAIIGLVLVFIVIQVKQVV